MNWFYSTDGEQQKGPISEDELIRAIKDRELNKDSLVWNEELDDWKKVSEIENLSKHFEIKPPPLPKKDKEPHKSATLDSREDFHSASSIYEEEEKEPDLECPECGNPIYLTDQNKVNGKLICTSCSNWIYLKDKKEEKPKYVYSSKEEETPLKWFKFYTNVRIPLIIFFTLINAASPPNYVSSGETQFLLAIGLIVTAIYLGLLYGLYNRKLWGWKMNWFVIALEILGAGFAYSEQPEFILLMMIAVAVIYGLPNYFYFKKRKHLFEK